MRQPFLPEDRSGTRYMPIPLEMHDQADRRFLAGSGAGEERLNNRPRVLFPIHLLWQLTT